MVEVNPRRALRYYVKNKHSVLLPKLITDSKKHISLEISCLTRFFFKELVENKDTVTFVSCSCM